MLFALRVRKVGTFICMEGQTKTTFERAKVVAKDIWILRSQSNQLLFAPGKHIQQSLEN